MSVSGLGIRVLLTLGNELGSVPFSVFWKGLWEIGIISFTSIEFICETLWIWRFLDGKVLGYQFNFFNRYRAIQIFNFLMYQLW